MNRETSIIGGVGIAVVAGLIAIFAFAGHGNSTSSTTADPAILIRSDSFETTAKNTKVTIVEFGDYQCPACGFAYPLLKTLMTNHPDNIVLVFRNFPLPQHANAQLAAKVALAAGKQNKYWQMHDKLYETQNDWADNTGATDLFKKYASDIGLNVDQFNQDLASNLFDSTISRDIADGNTLGVNATPTLYFNGQKYGGDLTADGFESAYQSHAK